MSCGSRLAADGTCTRCGTAPAPRGASLGLDDTAAAADDLPQRATVAVGSASRPRTRPSDDELPSGRIVAGRYRIVRSLGKGGMGEVVLARDLELDQSIALKFLPAELRGDAGHLARLRDEVKLARKVSHPNVCRVHDLGEADGRWFLTMEYVDGEDLGALLRRIGRLPPEKAVEIAHQLCSGLHAAHEQGILHRDLKPANVMIDGEGRLKITDFGLAALAHEIGGAQVREGTPAYMAPEQLAGAGVSRRSDIYALGLVLYELFTGKRAHGGERRVDTRPAAPSTLLDGLDPAIERVIMRCLEPDPEDRPASVLAVAAGLPGGDPIGAALAAGELPSPEMVAASGETGTLRPRLALVLLALVLVPLVVLGVLFERESVMGRLPTPDGPEVLAHRAHEIVEGLGVLPGGDVAYRFTNDLAVLGALKERRAAEGRTVYDDPPIHPLQLLWRADPGHLDPRDPLVSVDDPPFGAPGAVLVRIDARGRLVELRRVPPAVESAAADRVEAPWPSLLARTGLVADDLEAATPAIVPREFADERRAWTGRWPDGTPARVEAASVHGVPVMFLVVGPWDDRWAEIEPGDGSEPGADDSIIVVSGGSSRTLAGFEVVIALALALVVVGIAIGAMLLAIRSLRRGEGDRRTASRLALFVVVSTFLASTLGGHLTGSWLLVPVRRLPYALLDGALIWLAYIGLEPYARRFWPHALVSWSRFVRARWADALVGRDVLLGCASACVLIAAGALLVAGDPAKLELGDQGALLGARFALAAVLGLPKSGLWMACIAFLAVLVTRLVLRRQWATVLATIAAPTVALAIAEPSWTMMLSGLAIGISVAFTVFRAGLLGTVAWATTFVALDTFPWTFDASAWYAGYGSIAGLVVGGLAVASFWTALGGRPLLGDGFFGK